MKTLTHENGTFAYPNDEQDEQTLIRLGFYPVESDESYEASTAILEQAQATAEVQDGVEAALEDKPAEYCPTCGGSGKNPSDKRKKCPDCNA